MDVIVSVLPIHTSPNWPAPSFLMSFMESRGISHSSAAQGIGGIRVLHGYLSLWHKPFSLAVQDGTKRKWDKPEINFQRMR